MSHRIFVYGTLKRSQPNHYVIRDLAGESRYLGEAVTVDKWPLVIASQYNIPFLLGVKGVGKNVRGEVYEVDDVKLEAFDRLENHPTYYTRTPILIRKLTDPENEPLESETDPEEIDAYVIEKPQKSLLSLDHLANYVPDGIVCPYYALPLELSANERIWKEFINTIKDAD